LPAELVEERRMPRYKVYDYNQTELIPVAYRKQLLPSSF